MKLKLFWWITLVGLYSFVSKSAQTDTWDNIDIDTTHNDFLNDDGSGSKTSVHTTDDEDLIDEGSGQESGSGQLEVDIEKAITKAPTTAPTTKKLTACQQLRSSTKGFSTGYYIPECTPSGDYEKRQCEGKPGAQKCWCVDHKGREIPGTQMSEGQLPDCENGSNLKPCVFDVLKNSRGLLGAFHPRCTHAGEYEKIQCHNRECWCVDLMGKEKDGSRHRFGKDPITCEEPTLKPPVVTQDIIFNEKTMAPQPPTTKQPGGGYDFGKDDDKTDVVDKPDNVDISIDGGKFDEPKEDNNEIDKSEENIKRKPSAQSSFLEMMASPGILAAVIGGSVVGLLCAILLVMFIIYRMKKKDEGSYPLDEQKYTNYSYMKAPDKEYYA